jgi:hypothetical protein
VYRNGANSLALSGGGAGATWNGAAFYPNTTNARSLGSASNIWNQLFANYASTTGISASYASSTLYYGAGLSDCSGASNALTWSSGQFGCNAISGGSSFSYPFPGNATSTSITFSGGLAGALTGNASTATALQTGRTINGTTFDGTANITVTAASSTLLADSNTFSGNNTFSNTITGSITGNAGTVTNGVYTTTFGGLFDNRLSASSSIAGIITLPSLSLPYSQLTGTPSIAAYPFPSNATSTLLAFNGGLTAYASSTIGSGTAGLTISGNSTTTGSSIVAGTLAVGTTSPSVGFSPGITTGLNKNLIFSTDRDTQNFRGNIQFFNTSSTSKSGLEWYDDGGNSIAWLLAHYTNPDASPTDHKHIEIETADLSGQKQGRFTIGYGCDYDCLATFNQAEVQINRNTGQTNGNLLFSGGGQIRNTGSMQVVPNNGLNTKGFRIGTSTDGDIALDVTSGTELEILENANITGDGYVSGNVGIGTTSPLKQFTIEKSGAAGTVNGPQMFLRQNQTTINASSNTNLGEIYFGGADVLAGEEGFGAKIRAQASSFWNNTTNDYPADLLFFTQPDGGASGLTERLRITSAGNLGIGTTTPGSLLSVGDTAGINFSTATSSFSTTGGINLKSGCFAVAGTCLSAGGGSSFSYPFPSNATSTLLALNGGLTAYASSTIGNGTAGLTVSGNATTTGNSYLAGSLGVGTSTPFGKLSIQGVSGSTQPILNVASSSLASFFQVLPTGTTTIMGPVAATSTQYIYSTASGKGAAIIMEDEGGGACTQLTTKAGVLKAAVVTCPAEI